MIILIAGASHSGKTALAQRLIEKYHYLCLSIDHLKMGLIRSGHTTLTPSDDRELTAYLWPIVREMVKTAIENRQNMIVEGIYIPFDWAKDFDVEYLHHIRYLCLILSRRYIETHAGDIRRYANAVESRLEDDCDMDELIADNEEALLQCQRFGCEYLLIDERYPTDFTL
ncbi:MAG: AAA family ATPase [Clostridia bacterium]|nr:AAA family ATPase [Clostridia bacterium]